MWQAFLTSHRRRQTEINLFKTQYVSHVEGNIRLLWYQDSGYCISNIRMKCNPYKLILSVYQMERGQEWASNSFCPYVCLPNVTVDVMWRHKNVNEGFWRWELPGFETGSRHFDFRDRYSLRPNRDMTERFNTKSIVKSSKQLQLRNTDLAPWTYRGF